MSLLDVPLIQVALGLAFLYWAFALATLAINEGIAQKLGLRADTLEKAVTNLLGHDGLKAALYGHHLISATTEDPSDPDDKPSYMDSGLFASALTDSLGLTASSFSAASVQKAFQAESFKGAKAEALVALAKESDSLDDFRSKISAWFDAAMDRASGWYKRQMKVISFYVSLILIVAFNADTINAASILWAQPTARQELAKVADATGSLSKPPDPSFKAIHEAALQPLLGWHSTPKRNMPDPKPDDPLRLPRDLGGWALKMVGLLATVLLASLGAPFWFDILNRFHSISSSGPKPSTGGPRI